MTGLIKPHRISTRKDCPRYGITIIECGCVLVIVFILLTLALYAATLIIEGLLPQQAQPLAFVLVIVIFIYWGLVALFISRLHIRYRSLWVFPVMMGLPFGLACVPLIRVVLPSTLICVVVSIIGVAILAFFVQYAFLLLVRILLPEKRCRLPDVFPPIQRTSTERIKPNENLDVPARHPNDTRERREYYNLVVVPRVRALEALMLDNDMETYQYQFALSCQKELYWGYKHDKAMTIGELPMAEKIIRPFAVCDFTGAKEWAEYALDRLELWPFAFPKRDFLMISAICTLIMENVEAFNHFSRQLKRPVDFLSRITSREPEYLEILISGLAQNDIDLCRRAIRLQCETWYRPDLFELRTYHINLEGVAMTNICRWRGIAIPPIEPIIPENLIYSMTTDDSQTHEPP